MTDKFVASNGAEIEICFAGFREAMNLKNAIYKNIVGNNIKIASIKLDGFSIDEMKNLNADSLKQNKDKIIKSLLSSADNILQFILSVDSDSEINKSIFSCLKKCRYNKQKITEELFEDEKAIEAYYEIVIACIKKNLAPFLKPLIAKLSKLNQNQETNLESKSG